MEEQAEIHSLPSERKSLLQSTSHSTIPYDRIVNSMRQARKNRDLLKLAEQIEVLDDQGALRPEIHKVENHCMALVWLTRKGGYFLIGLQVSLFQTPR